MTSTANEMNHGFQDWWLKVEKTEAEKEISLRGSTDTGHKTAACLQRCLKPVQNIQCYAIECQVKSDFDSVTIHRFVGRLSQKRSSITRMHEIGLTFFG